MHVSALAEKNGQKVSIFMSYKLIARIPVKVLVSCHEQDVDELHEIFPPQFCRFHLVVLRFGLFLTKSDDDFNFNQKKLKTNYWITANN